MLMCPLSEWRKIGPTVEEILLLHIVSTKATPCPWKLVKDPAPISYSSKGIQTEPMDGEPETFNVVGNSFTAEESYMDITTARDMRSCGTQAPELLLPPDPQPPELPAPPIPQAPELPAPPVPQAPELPAPPMPQPPELPVPPIMHAPHLPAPSIPEPDPEWDAMLGITNSEDFEGFSMEYSLADLEAIPDSMFDTDGHLIDYENFMPSLAGIPTER